MSQPSFPWSQLEMTLRVFDGSSKSSIEGAVFVAPGKYPRNPLWRAVLRRIYPTLTLTKAGAVKTIRTQRWVIRIHVAYAAENPSGLTALRITGKVEPTTP